jgi:hypothetical protein
MGANVPPSQFLPQLGRSLARFTPAVLSGHIAKLGQIFQPRAFRGSARPDA